MLRLFCTPPRLQLSGNGGFGSGGEKSQEVSQLMDSAVGSRLALHRAGAAAETEERGTEEGRQAEKQLGVWSVGRTVGLLARNGKNDTIPPICSVSNVEQLTAVAAAMTGEVLLSSLPILAGPALYRPPASAAARARSEPRCGCFLVPYLVLRGAIYQQQCFHVGELQSSFERN